MAAAPTPHAGSRATSLPVRIGVAALLLGVIELARLAGTWRQGDGSPAAPEKPPG